MKNNRLDTGDVIFHTYNIIDMEIKKVLNSVLIWTVLLLIAGLATNHAYVSSFMPMNSGATVHTAAGPAPSPATGPVPSLSVGLAPPKPLISLADYNNRALGINLKHPLDWKIDTIKNGIQIIKDKDITYVEIRLHSVKNTIDLKQYVDDDIAGRTSSREHFKILDGISPAIIATNIPAYKGTYTFLKTEGFIKDEIQKILRYWFLVDDKIYTVAYVSTIDKFDTDKSVADAIISSIEMHSPDSTTKNLLGVIDSESDHAGKPVTLSGKSKSDDVGVKTFTINFGATDSQTVIPISPKALRVESGTMVMWINNDNTPHTIVSTSHDNNVANTFYSNKLEPGEKYTLDTTPGVYEFYDPLWPNIRGTLTVLGQTGNPLAG